jgi:hypothetical protein
VCAIILLVLHWLILCCNGACAAAAAAAATRLITYGFHSNLPKASDLLSPTAWLQMLVGIVNMPKFDPMALVTSSKAIMGFNLSFFADEVTGSGQSTAVRVAYHVLCFMLCL